MWETLIAIGIAIIFAGVWYFRAKLQADPNDPDAPKLPGFYRNSLVALLVVYSLLLIGFQLYANWRVEQAKTAFNGELRRVKAEQRERTRKLRESYMKEMAFMAWKNKVFTSNADVEQELAKVKAELKLPDNEVKMWRGVAENNTLEKLVPKKNSQDVLKEYQSRLKQNLSQIRSGQELLTSDVRLLSENINAIRVIGKAYEKVLQTFRDLHDSISANPDAAPPEPKQQYFLFFPVKRKEYEQLLRDYSEAKGNQQARLEFSAKLKVAIEKAENEMKEINRQFEANLSFIETGANTINFNNEKLQNLIEAGIREAEIIKEAESATQTPLKVQAKPKNKG